MCKARIAQTQRGRRGAHALMRTASAYSWAFARPSTSKPLHPRSTDSHQPVKRLCAGDEFSEAFGPLCCLKNCEVGGNFLVTSLTVSCDLFQKLEKMKPASSGPTSAQLYSSSYRQVPRRSCNHKGGKTSKPSKYAKLCLGRHLFMCIY